MLEQFDTQGIDCTGDVCVGDVIKFSEGVFGGSRSRPRYLGKRTIYAEVIRDSYGAHQHTFTLDVWDCVGIDAEDVLDKADRRGFILRKGRNVYRNGTKRLPRDNEQRQAQLDDKHRRGDAHRERKAMNRDFAIL